MFSVSFIVLCKIIRAHTSIMTLQCQMLLIPLFFFFFLIDLLWEVPQPMCGSQRTVVGVSPFHMNFRDETQVLRLGGKWLYLLSHFDSPPNVVFDVCAYFICPYVPSAFQKKPCSRSSHLILASGNH